VSLGVQARRVGFWSLDRIKGRPVWRHYQDISSKMRGDGVEARLEQLLQHATATTDFYASYRGHELSGFPVISKETYKSHFDELVSSLYRDQPGHLVHTSGSTGTPFTLRQNRDKRHRVIAETIYFNEQAGYRVGDKLLWLRAWTLENSKSAVQRRIQNVVPVELVGMDDAGREAVVGTLREGSFDSIVGYSTALWSLARYIERIECDPADFGLRAAISGAETLPLPRKRRMEVAFGCPVVDRYSNEENGILASTMPTDDRFHLNRASYVFEFLRLRSNEPQEPGSPARVVVTDLYNEAMPMIRYATGDLAIVAEPTKGAFPSLKSIEGRQSDVIYDTFGRELSASIADYVPYYFPDIAEYQLVQAGAAEYRLRIAPQSTAYRAEDFTAMLRGLLGPEARVTVEFMDTIPKQANAKFRTIVSEYQPIGSDAADA
jgi:phenylacetate-CoA ligase